MTFERTPTEILINGIENDRNNIQYAKNSIYYQFSQYLIIVYIDQVTIKHIAHSTTLKSSSLERSNLHLIRAAQYLAQFKILVHYRPRKENISTNALSRLEKIDYMNTNTFMVDNDILPENPVDDSTIMLLQMTPDFIAR